MQGYTCTPRFLREKYMNLLLCITLKHRAPPDFITLLRPCLSRLNLTFRAENSEQLSWCHFSIYHLLYFGQVKKDGKTKSNSISLEEFALSNKHNFMFHSHLNFRVIHFIKQISQNRIFKWDNAFL